jgi:hypothetical protein
MKHCPNPECGGIAKFKIISEFNDSATSCSDCGGRLIEGPAPRLEDRIKESSSAPEPDLELVPVYLAENEPELLLVESVLKQNEIPYLAKGEQIQDLFGFGQLVVVNPITGPVEIHVRMDDAEAARELLAETLE